MTNPDIFYNAMVVSEMYNPHGCSDELTILTQNIAEGFIQNSLQPLYDTVQGYLQKHLCGDHGAFWAIANNCIITHTTTVPNTDAASCFITGERGVHNLVCVTITLHPYYHWLKTRRAEDECNLAAFYNFIKQDMAQSTTKRKRKTTVANNTQEQSGIGPTPVEEQFKTPTVVFLEKKIAMILIQYSHIINLSYCYKLSLWAQMGG
nr:ORF60 [Acipenserid herpesvirus 1]